MFLPIVFAGFLFLNKYNPKLSIHWLVCASLFYYAWWRPEYVTLLIASIAVNFYLATLLDDRERSPHARKAILIVGVTANLFVLGLFKYLGLFAEGLNVLGAGITVPEIVLPIGISFFTFQQIAYLADTYQGVSRDRGLAPYALFVVFFPQLIAGPIVHHSEMLPQFRKRAKVGMRWPMIQVGLFLFIAGLTKKVWIADSLGVYADAAFAAADDKVILSFAEAWAGTLAYTFQLYFDFSGYSDMASGLALMFGVRLPINFFSPYKARSIIDFWRRWHITLSRFLRDYLYIPLGGNRHGVLRRWGNLMAVMVLGGLWHGASLNYVLWGTLHGFYLLVNHAWRWVRRGRQGRPVSRLGAFTSWSLTFLVVVIAWTFFRAGSIQSALSVLSSMTLGHGVSVSGALRPLLDAYVAYLPNGVSFNGFFFNGLADWKMGISMIVCAGIVAIVGPNVLQITYRYRPVLGLRHFDSQSNRRLVWRPTGAWQVVTGILLAACIVKISGESPFLYFQF